ncbi:MAG: xylosidase, partial [Candidatus Hydrogenedentes bacterium]|nr:xylosidase [Candidatus Hydrogenedentota bacterium]
HIYRCTRGLWLDWMTQGTRVSRNLFHDNPGEDLFVEVSHGPFLVDNNVFLSGTSLLSVSRGGAYVHNLFAGNIRTVAFDARLTPYHKAHSTELAGMHNNPRGDDRYYNNLFVGSRGLNDYDDAQFPPYMDGNVFLKGAQFSKHEKEPLVQEERDPGIILLERPDGWYLEGLFDSAWATAHKRALVTTELLGKALIPALPYENPNGTPLRIDRDYFGKPRNPENPFPGPFALSQVEEQVFKVWPVNGSN